MIFDLDSYFNYETTYTVAMSTRAEDLDVNSLTSEYTWQLTTIVKLAEEKVVIFSNPYIKSKTTIERISFANLLKDATINIYTVSGKLIKTIKHKDTADGGSAEWDISRIASRVYMYCIELSEGIKEGKVNVIK